MNRNKPYIRIRINGKDWFHFQCKDLKAAHYVMDQNIRQHYPNTPLPTLFAEFAWQVQERNQSIPLYQISPTEDELHPLCTIATVLVHEAMKYINGDKFTLVLQQAPDGNQTHLVEKYDGPRPPKEFIRKMRI